MLNIVYVGLEAASVEDKEKIIKLYLLSNVTKWGGERPVRRVDIFWK